MINPEAAVVYDIESYPNVFTLDMKTADGQTAAVWEISEFRNDQAQLMTWFNWLRQTQTPMVGFNNLAYDYPVIHFIYTNPNCTVQQIYQKSQQIIDFGRDFKNKGKRNPFTIWANKRFAPQIDLFKLNHMDNPSKRTSLKALQINMRIENVVEMSIPWGSTLTKEQVENDLIPYNKHDVKATDVFFKFNKTAIDFRNSLIADYGMEVLNWNDTKIGEEKLIKQIGEEVCFDWSSGKKEKRQTPRSRIEIQDVIFPYVKFEHPEFNRILDYFKSQVLTSHDIKEIGEVEKVKTKGFFKNLVAKVGGIDFVFGTGGIHASVKSQKIEATEDWLIRDIDVKSLYPSIAIANRLYPEHLGETFVKAYAQLTVERAYWQKEKGKKCGEANSCKLGQNGAYGKSNSAFSVFYDPKFTVTITINGQLLLCMLSEQIIKVPTLKLIQVNTDGVTYYVHKDYEPQVKEICKWWEQLTALVLEDEDYKRMFIRDVNNYVAEDFKGKLKLKGAYWTPDPLRYAESISEEQPPAWHKDLGNCVSVRAAVANMVHGVDIETYIRSNKNPYDFMCRIKLPSSNKLTFNGVPVTQLTGRYYVSLNGGELIKEMPPLGELGTFKRAGGVSEAEYNRVMAETGGQWHEDVCSKNKSVYERRFQQVEAGCLQTICNDVNDFDFDNVDYQWYINEARKLVL